MKKIAFAAIAALAGVVMAADTKVGTIKFGNDYKLTEGSVTHQSLSDYALTSSLGDLATMDTITLALVTDAGDLAGMDSITLAKVTDAGTAAASDATAFATAAQGGKADSALQASDITVTTASNGGISVKVGSADAVSTSLGSAATTASTAYATAAQGTKADAAMPAANISVAGTALAATDTLTVTSSNSGKTITVAGATGKSVAVTDTDTHQSLSDYAKVAQFKDTSGNAKASDNTTTITLGNLAAGDTVSASVIDVELGDYYLVEGTSGNIDVMKRAAE